MPTIKLVGMIGPCPSIAIARTPAGLPEDTFKYKFASFASSSLPSHQKFITPVRNWRLSVCTLETMLNKHW
jgi:hypothetical protein